ncbi:MAG: AmmeMemoRadiSam system protein A [Vicinamibacteria bacterium]
MSSGVIALSAYGLTRSQREELLRIARQTIESLLGGSEVSYVVRDPALEKPGAAFVTLTRQGILRGCVGYSDPLFPLHQTVSRCARSAATDDHRFPPVQPHELPDLRISISVLSVLRKLESPEDVLIGRDGLQVVGAGRRGLLLPQVATEQGWDRERFLDGVCHKAGLPSGAWRGGQVEVFAFEAEIFLEDEPTDSTGSL